MGHTMDFIVDHSVDPIVDHTVDYCNNTADGWHLAGGLLLRVNQNHSELFKMMMKSFH